MIELGFSKVYVLIQFYSIMLVFVTMLFTLKPPMGITTTTTVQVLKFCGVLYLGLTWLLKHIILIR